MRLETYMGRRIRRLRIAGHLSVEQLATACGIPKADMVAYEQGRRRVSAEHLMRVAQILDVSFIELFPNADTIPQAPPERTIEVFEAEETAAIEEAGALQDGS